MHRWSEVREAFERALDVRHGDWLEVLAGHYDEEILANVRKLMHHKEASVGFLEPPPAGVIESHIETAPAHQALPDMQGQRVADRFEIGRQIGRGGAGDVYEAQDAFTRSRVAVKFVGREVGQEILSDESAALRLLRLPGVVTLLDDGFTDGLAFLVMEYVDGRPFPGVPPAVAWNALERPAVALLETLARIHWHGVVHRDLKPSNVLIDGDGRPMILDLGIATDVQADAASTQRLALAATPEYAAPEQRRGEPATRRSDLYSVGVMLHEALTGVNPHHAAAPPSIEGLAPHVPIAVARLVVELLAPDPADRPASAAEALALLPAFFMASAAQALFWKRDQPFTTDELAALFHGPERLQRLPSDAAEELWKRTHGVPTEVYDEIDAWDRAGLARWEGQRLSIDRRALERLRDGLRVRIGDETIAPAAPLDVNELARQTIERADGLLIDGQAARALAALDDVLRATGGRLAPEDTEPAFVALLRATIAVGSVSAFDRFRYRLNRSAVREAFATRLDRIAHAAVAAMQGDAQRAGHLLTSPESAESDAELQCLMSIWMYVVRSQPDTDREESLRRAEKIAQEAGTPAVKRAVMSTRTWIRYTAGAYGEAAQMHAEAAKTAQTRLERVNLTMNAASAWLEAGAFDHAAQLAETCAVLAGECRHPMQEARAEWVARSARYRRGDKLTSDAELVAAAQTLGAHNVEAMLYLNEAAIARRAGDYLEAARLADMAASAWSWVGRHEPAFLARALALACGSTRGIEDLPELATRVSTIKDVPIAIQCAGLLASVHAAERETLLAFAQAQAAMLDMDVDRSLCREILSISDSLK